MTPMLLTILKIVAGIAVLGIISLVLIAVISGLRMSAQAVGKPEDRRDDLGAGRRDFDKPSGRTLWNITLEGSLTTSTSS
jgi:hypothetical protein